MLHQNRVNFLIGPIFGLIATAMLTGCGAENSPGGSPPPPPPPSAAGTTVQVSVKAKDLDGDKLHYRWAVTEGKIENVDAPTTTWTVPRGSGLQFVYALVSDEKGGYAERRAAALTFTDASPGTAFNFTSPTIAPPTVGFAWGTMYHPGKRNVYLPGVTISGSGNGTSFTTTTDLKGEFFIPNLPFGSYTADYSLPGGITGSFNFSVAAAALPTSPSAESYKRVEVPGGALRLMGHIALADGSLCGIRNEFFTNPADANLLAGPRSATVELLNTSNQSLSAVVSVNHYGDFFVTRSQSQFDGFPNARLRVRCEEAPDKIVDQVVRDSGDVIVPPITIDASLNPVTPNRRPDIDVVTVMLNGEDISRPDLPQPTTALALLPELNLTPGDDIFLTYKGIDTRKGACAYYHKIGAVQDCDANGFPTGGQLTLDQWRKTFNLSPFHDGNPLEPEKKAIYINKQDLNLARDMQGIKRQNGALAFNVCNYPGPQDVNDRLGKPKLIGAETEPDINLAIDNAKRGIGKVVCVAMDYSEATGVRFYTFGPSGKLLLSVSLDGRREKFMPGTCVACHGGDNYGGKFPDDYSPTNPTGSGQANLSSYFLPFDIANFYFSTKDPSLSRDKLLRPLREMNELLASISGNPTTKPITDDLKSLITTRWYPDTNKDNEQTNPAPSIYSTQPDSLNGTDCKRCHGSGTPGSDSPGPYNAAAKHAIGIAQSCQICHTSNYLVPDPIGTGSPRLSFLERPPSHYLRGSNDAPRGPHSVCGGSPDLKMNYTMPNALGTFERFWLKKGTDQPAALFSIPPPGSGPQLGACSAPKPHPGL